MINKLKKHKKALMNIWKNGIPKGLLMIFVFVGLITTQFK